MIMRRIREGEHAERMESWLSLCMSVSHKMDSGRVDEEKRGQGTREVDVDVEREESQCRNLLSFPPPLIKIVWSVA